MPVSQAASWYLIGEAQSAALYSAAMYVAFFYFVWALYNYFYLNEPELGQYSMGLLTVATFFKRRIFSMVGTRMQAEQIQNVNGKNKNKENRQVFIIYR